MNKKGILVIDVEKTCWEKGSEEKANNKSEIIQIGVVDLDFKSLNIKRQKSIYIQPKLHGISEYCTNLTGINQKLIDKEGIEFNHAMSILAKHWGISNKKIVFWGNDQKDFYSDISLNKTENKISDSIFNFADFYSHLYHLNYQDNFRNIGLKTALIQQGLIFEGSEHNALYDAYNTAMLYKKIMKRVNI